MNETASAASSPLVTGSGLFVRASVPSKVSGIAANPMFDPKVPTTPGDSKVSAATSSLAPSAVLRGESKIFKFIPDKGNSVLSLEIPGELTFLHHLYIISFSVFYAVMLHTIRGIRAFDTSAAFTADPRSLRRFVLSILFLNLLPFLHFSIILLYLLHYLALNIFSILVVFALSISVFGFDKVFHTMLIRFNGMLYTSSEYQSVINSESAARKFSSHYLQYLIPGLLYILVPLGLLLLQFDLASGIVTIVGIVAGSFVAWHRWHSDSDPRPNEQIDSSA